jgi:hypothetical protein
LCLALHVSEFAGPPMLPGGLLKRKGGGCESRFFKIFAYHNRLETH